MPNDEDRPQTESSSDRPSDEVADKSALEADVAEDGNGQPTDEHGEPLLREISSDVPPRCRSAALFYSNRY